MKEIELKQALKDTIEIFLDDVDYLKLQKIDDEKWNRIITALKYELNTVGIKVG